jgi:hypothetical protein
MGRPAVFRLGDDRVGQDTAYRMPGDADDPERPELVRQEPRAGIGRALDLVAQGAADRSHSIQEADEVEVGATGSPRTLIDLREDPHDVVDPTRQPGLLFELAEDRLVWVLAELDAAAGERPRARLDLVRRQPAEEDSILLVQDDSV